MVGASLSTRRFLLEVSSRGDRKRFGGRGIQVGVHGPKKGVSTDNEYPVPSKS